WATPDSDVAVYLGTTLLDTVSADSTTGAWTLDYTGTTLSQGAYTFSAVATLDDVPGDPSPNFVVTVDLTDPSIALTVPATTTSTTPLVQADVTDSGGAGLLTGDTVTFDVDLNNDGDF